MSDQSLFPQISGVGHAFFWCASSQLLARVQTVLASKGVTEVPLGESGVICFLSDDFESLMPILDHTLSVDERRDVRTLLSERPLPKLHEFAGIQTVEQLGLKLSAQWLGDMLAERRYKSLLQPIVGARDHSAVLGYEFLIRGLHTDGTEIGAPNLFETAESAGMLYALDMAAGESATRTAQMLDLKSHIFVNVLPRTIDDKDGFDAWLSAVLSNIQLEQNQLVFEIVESQQLADLDAVRRLVDELHDRGILIALDDFGAGFNNLAAITDIQPDFIKLDKSLTRDVMHDGRKWTLVANIVDSAKQSDIRVIAEGVEDRKTASALESAGVDYMQGYYFGRPSDEPI